jgi:hypothetical protein
MPMFEDAARRCRTRPVRRRMVEHPFWPSLLALYAEEIAPELEGPQDVDVDSLILCDECGAELENGACPYCQDDF